MRSISSQISLYFGILMVIIVTVGGIAILFTDIFSDRLYGNKRIVFVVILFAYAIYRGYRTYHLMKERKNEY